MRRLLLSGLSWFVAAGALVACGAESDVSAPAPRAVACAAPTPDLCEERCVDLGRDPLACGECGVACPAGAFCVEGRCEAECGGLYPDQCGDACVDQRSDRDHCGECGKRCDVGDVCSGGRCASECSGYTPDQCGSVCVDLRSDPRACGACDSPCEPGQLCLGGQCTDACGGARPDECSGRCVDTLTDPLFCGGCDTACPVGQVCSDGQCLEGCSGPLGEYCDGLCVDLERDPRACGRCGTSCLPGAVCSGGTCAVDCLEHDEQRCGDACVVVASDPRHCGECDAACPEGQFCSDGHCSDTCGGSTPIRCGSRCVAEDEAGACGLECRDATPSSCAGRCVDLTSDADHCGSCDAPCALGEHCVAGECEPACPSDAPDVCLGACVDKQSDEEHCGTCGNACQDGRVCDEGKCVLECEPGSVECGDACVDTSSDAAHCGGCGKSCDDTQRCDEGSCVSHVLEIAGGQMHLCGRLKNGEVACLGSNSWGQIGDADLPDDDSQLGRVQGLASAVALSAGSEFTCAILADGTVTCWGANYYGQTSDDPLVSKHEEPFPVPGVSSARAIASGFHHTCVLTESDSVQCWGFNMNGQLGRDGSDSSTYQPGAVDDLPSALESISCGGSHCCVRREHPAPDVYCWGEASDGQLGNGAGTPSLAVEVSDLPALDASRSVSGSVALGNMHTCAIGGDGDVYCWGSNYYGELGVAVAATNVVQVVGLPLPAAAVMAGVGRSCALLEDGALWCWGIRFDGSTNGPTPELVIPGSAGAVHVELDRNFFGNAFVFTDGANVLSFGGYTSLLGRSPVPAYQPRSCCTGF